MVTLGWYIRHRLAGPHRIEADQLIEVQRHHCQWLFPAGKPHNLRIQRVALRPIVVLGQLGAEQEDQIAEEIAREQESSPNFHAG